MEHGRFFTSEKLSPNLERTPDGFLICHDVPVARIGTLLYGPGETPVKPGLDGLVRIERHERDVFDPDSMASLHGKPVVNEHPPDAGNPEGFDILPHNWGIFAKGTAVNPRRGESLNDDVLITDLIVNDKDTIADILAGKREVSAGYVARYIDLGNGRGRQEQIRFNHVALVDSGRCGERCSIRDHAPKENVLMRIKEAILNAFKTRDEKSLSTALAAVRDEEIPEAARKEDSSTEHPASFATHDEHEALRADHENLRKVVDTCMGMCKTHDSAIAELRKGITVHDEDKDEKEEKEEKETKDESTATVLKDATGNDKRTVKDEDKEEEKEEEPTKDEESEIKEELPVGAADSMCRARDSNALVDAYQTTLSLCEIIAPGMQFKALDAKRPLVQSFRDMCNLRRKALILGTHDATTLSIMEQISGHTRTIDAAYVTRLPCGRVRDMFMAVGTAKQVAHRQATKDSVNTTFIGSYYAEHGMGDGIRVVGKLRTPADINKANRAAFGAKGKE